MQLFYYEGTSSCITLRVPERVNRVISQISFELCLLKIPQQTKNMFKVDKKGMFQECYLGVIMSL